MSLSDPPLTRTLATAGDGPIWLRVGVLLDGSDAAPLRDAHLVYDRHTIRFVGHGGQQPRAEHLRPGQTQPDVHLPDHTALPGLVDAHTHLFLEGGQLDPLARAAYLEQTDAVLLSRARARLEALVRLGLAGVRDAGDKNGVGIALSRLSASAARPLMPYVESPGAAIHRRGRYGSFMAEPLDDFASAHACVHARVDAGADRIKLIPTGIINFTKGAVTASPQMTTAEIEALVEAAASFSRQTFAHASGEDGIGRAIDGGVDSVEHGFFVSHDQLARMRDRGTAWVPTFAPVQKQIDHADRLGWSPEVVDGLRRILSRHGDSVRLAAEMGVTIAAGSDAGSYGVAHGAGLFDELESMAAAGLSTRAIIHAATGAGAARFGYKDPIGRLEAGARSRFLVTPHSPLDAIANLRRPATVVFDGVAMDRLNPEDATGL